MATKSRENKRAISALKKDGWKEHTSGMFYEHPMGTSILIQLRWMGIFRPLFVDSVLEQVGPNLRYNNYVLIKTKPDLHFPHSYSPPRHPRPRHFPKHHITDGNTSLTRRNLNGQKAVPNH